MCSRSLLAAVAILLLIPDVSEAIWYRWTDAMRLNGRRLGITLAADPYKSYLNINLDLKRRRPIERGHPEDLGMTDAMGSEGTSTQERDELHFYHELLTRSLKPGYILFELDYHPLTHLGTTYFEGEKSKFRIISPGYDQMLSYTVFFGELLPFFTRLPGQAANERPGQTGWAMAGLLFTYSNRRVSRNVLYWDRWYNLQWKLRAVNQAGGRSMTWQVATGFTIHENPRFQQALTFNFSRNRSDHSFKGWSFFRNAGWSYDVEVPVDRSVGYDSVWDFFRLHRLTYTKHYPVGWTRSSMLHLSLGFAWERVKLFNPTRFDDNFQVLIGPNLSF